MILYIAGYGRSGSTILDIILGNHPTIIGVGEVAYLVDEWEYGKCGCGQNYDECSFWKDLFPTGPMAGTGSASRKIESLPFLPRLILGHISKADLEKYNCEQKKLFHYIYRQSGRSIVVDSSKSARWCVGRFLALRKLTGYDVFVLHLVRNGEDVLQSLTATGSNWALAGRRPPITAFPALRAIVGWVSANVSTYLLSHILGHQRYLRIRYEDLIACPREQLQRIGAFIGVDMDPIIDKLENNSEFSVGHQVGGNRLKHASRVRLLRNVATEQKKLKFHEKLLFVLLAGWLQILLGYKI
jgi:Sulfotransferase family